jgi:hypothetical protein
MITPRHSFESIVRELRKGIQDGSVVLGGKAESARIMAHVWNPRYQKGKSDSTTFYTFTATVTQKGSFIELNVTRHLVVTVSGDPRHWRRFRNPEL